MQRFLILEELAAGGTGVVYKAQDRETGAIVALKKLSARVEYPEREWLLARSISHPNVCKVFEFFRDEGQACISMELVDGETLAAYLKQHDSLPVHKALNIARQIIHGVEAAHKAGI